MRAVKFPLLIAVFLLACTTAPKPQNLPLDENADLDFPGTSVLARPLAPISGGTLAVSLFGEKGTILAADSQRDVVWLADAKSPYDFRGRIDMPPHSEPGRVVMGPNSKAFVALRATGDVATLDLESQTLVETRHLCAETRGLAWDVTEQTLHVACREGDVVTLSETGIHEKARTFVAPDLRDVAVVDGAIFVSEFRTPRLWKISPDRTVFQIGVPNAVHLDGRNFLPQVGWRMLADGVGGLIMVHQDELTGPLPPEQYGSTGEAPGSVIATVSQWQPDPASTPQFSLRDGTRLTAGMPVDIALSPNMPEYVVADPSQGLVEVHYRPDEPALGNSWLASLYLNDPVALAYLPNGDFVVQTLTPELRVYSRAGGLTLKQAIDLPGWPLDNDGHRLFHRATKAKIACAQCHPEGREDGHLWTLNKALGPRRTQTVSGQVLETAPLHWDGAFLNFSELMTDTFVDHMHGSPNADFAALGGWVNRLPAASALPHLDPAQVLAGKALFESETVGCTSCHNGPHLTDNSNRDVGTGAALQVPSLIGVSARLPIMHNGCAKTIRDRFSPACGGGEQHGQTSHLSASEIDDSVAYLGSL